MTSMHRSKQFLSAAALAVMSVGGLPALAATSPINGTAFINADAGCFLKSQAGTVVNGCGNQPPRTWCMGEYISSSGTKTVTVNALVPLSQQTKLVCTARAVNRQGTPVSQASATSQFFDVSADLPAMSVSVPAFGSLVVCCNLGFATRINTMNF